MVPMPDGSSLWMDEQSMLKKLPRNIEAEWRFGKDVHCGRLHGTVAWAQGGAGWTGAAVTR